MTRVAGFKRFDKEDYRTSPDWFDDFLENLNPMIDALNPLLQNSIDIDNNLLAERQTVAVTHNVPITLTMKRLKQTPFLVRAGYAQGHIVTGCNITAYNSNGSIQVTVLFNDAPTTAVSTVLIFEP
jgi:hypothetical protein